MDDSAQRAEHFDVLIVGAGISGIGGAHHLQEQCPGRSFVVLEAQAGFGGTWRTHRYPGIRSDSDLYTFGYRFKPWVGAPIASAQAILDYMGEVIAEAGIDRHIRYGHTVLSARWSSAENLWSVETRRRDGEIVMFTAGFLWMCQGYYRHSEGYTPEWPGMDRFQGQIVHPQTWPQDIDLAGKNVVVIGSPTSLRRSERPAALRLRSRPGLSTTTTKKTTSEGRRSRTAQFSSAPRSRTGRSRS